MNERQLIERVLLGDADAERALYEAHVDRVYRLAYKMTGDATMAEDLTQDTFIRAFDRLGGFRGESAFSTWLFSLASSVILNGIRKVKRVRTRETRRDDIEAVAATAPKRDLELRHILERAITELPESYRLVFVMHEMEGYTHQEIASTMGTPVGTAKVRLTRAREKLRTLLGRKGVQLRMELE